MPNRKQGRPRDSQVDHAIVAATRELLAERGYAGLTVDRVAARAGVGKAAIYRRYATKQELTFAVALHDLREAPPPDGGSLRADLAAITAIIAGQIARPPAGVLAGLVADVHADPALTERFAQTFVAAERRVATEVPDRAVARGELTSLPDTATVHALLLGQLFAWRLLLMQDPEQLPTLASKVAEFAAIALLTCC